MRGKDEQQLDVFSYVSPEQRVPQDHPSRPLRVMTDEALRELQPRLNNLYAKTGRPSIAPEKLLRALLLQVLYSVRSERMLMEQLNYNLLFRCEQIPGTKQVTVGGDKGYDTADFVAECRNLKVTPHVAQNLERPGGSAIDARTTHHAGYAISQKKRKRVEECFGWLKTIALLRKVRHRGVFKVGWVFTFAAAPYNLVRMRNLAIQAT
jgi:Transposase domain (DUF772)/Transposase DDE domain